MKNTALIMTPLPTEYMAVSRHLSERNSIVHEGGAYEIGKFQTSNGSFQIIVGEPGMRNASMAVATERAIHFFEPQIAILCGIAGGIKDVKVGDVAVARSAFDYDSGKELDNGFLPRPVEYQFSDELIAYAKLVQRAKNWKSRTLDGAQDAEVYIASVASGDKVIGAVNNTTFSRIQQYLSHCKFLEMEAAGFGLAVQRHRHVHALVVRGISDMCFNKTEADDKDWQPMAADRAAAFVFELIYQTNFEHLTKSPMNAKTIAKQVVNLLFPLLQLDAVKQIGSEFKEASNQSIKELWEYVRPTFIKEIEAEDTEADAQVAIRSSLRKQVEQDEDLKRKLERLLEVEGMGKVQEGTVNITDSKNVIQGSDIDVKGDFYLGDKEYKGQVIQNKGKVGKQINIDKHKGDIHL